MLQDTNYFQNLYSVVHLNLFAATVRHTNSLQCNIMKTQTAGNIITVSNERCAGAGLVKPKTYDWKDSNLALFGSDTEKQVKSKNTPFIAGSTI